MAYKYDASDVSSLVKEGDYEVLIERMEVKTIPSGKNKLSIMYRIRNDVNQPYGNKAMFEDIWEMKDTPGVFNRKRINQLLGTQPIEDGQEFESINDIIKFLENAPLIIHISIDFDNYRGEDVNSVSYYKKTKVVPQQVGGENPPPKMATQPEQQKMGLIEDTNDGYLPF